MARASLASLIVVPETEGGREAFVFDHDQLHRALTTAEALRGNKLPLRQYILDPVRAADAATRAGPFNLDHQRAHNDFGLQARGNVPTQILIDHNLSDPASLAWWTHVNLRQHFIDNQTV